jgi:cytoskeletal protein CcmA (bactofilin family)
MEAEGKLELKKTATAIGSFKTNGLLVEEGAVVSGSLEMKVKDEAAPADTKKSWNSKPVE